MSVNVFGLSGNKSKHGVTKKDLDSKFVSLTKNLQTKINKTGDTLSGNLNLGGHKITDLAIPILDNDASTKKFVESESISTKLYIDSMLQKKLDKNFTENLNMNKFAITNVSNPTDSLHAVNKLYMQISVQLDEISTNKILKIGNIISTLLNKYSNLDKLNKYTDRFSKALGYVKLMDVKCTTEFENDENIYQLLQSCTLYPDLTVLIIQIVEDLPKDIFIEFKTELHKDLLYVTPEAKTLRKKYRRFINKCARDIDPSRSNEVLELLVQKNILLIDLGFCYFIEKLLKLLLAN